MTDAVNDIRTAPGEAPRDAMSEVATLTGDPVVSEARKRWDRAAEWESQARERFISDLKFAHADSENGYQWPDAIRRNRDVDKRPCLTMNITRQHNLQIINEGRQNKAAVAVRACGSGATKDAADVFGDCIRRIEYQSNAQAAYLCAFDFAVNAGIGWWRITTDFASEDTFDQEIFIRGLKDPLAVYMDPDIQEKDGSDAEWAFVFSTVPREDFLKRYPKAEGFATMEPLGINSGDTDYVFEDSVRICEYFRRVRKPDQLVSFIDPTSGQRKEVRKSKLPAGVYKQVAADSMSKTRPTESVEVEWKLIAGEKIIDEEIWPGKYIPLVRVIGEETVIEGILDRKGHTRSMLDPQRMYNYNAAQSCDTKIPTPNGWTTMGQLKTGDWIFDHLGKAVQIKEALPIKIGEPCFKITFDTGYSVVTDGGHIWCVEERGKRRAKTYDWSVKTISTIELESGKHFIKFADPLCTEEKEFLVDPYLLGMWLGDGSSSEGVIAAHLDDADEEIKLLEDIGYTTSDKRSVVGNGCVFTVYGIRGKLNSIGVLGDKHIPQSYLRGSKQQRLALLQGLMDTDGHFAPAVNQCVFVNKNKAIVKGFLELCVSLGIKTTVSRQPEHAKYGANGNVFFTESNFRVQFTADPDVSVFRLSRKAVAQTAGRPTHWRRTKRIGIKSIEQVDSVPVRCITLDTPEHLFLCTEGMIPTHNSAQVEFVALQSKTPYIASAKAIEEYETMWNTANQVNHSVLIYNNVDDNNPDMEIQPPKRQEPPNFSPGFQQGMETAFNQMMMTSGQWQNQMGMMGNERTGAAINARQAQSDTSVYHYQDNYADALRFTGKQLLDLIPKIYDTQRVFEMQAEDGESYELTVDPQARQAYQQKIAATGQAVQRIFNPMVGKYDVEADVGTAYGTRRQETAEALTLLLTQAPALTGLVGDLLVRSMDFPEAQEAAARLRRMLPPQALGQGPSPNEQKLQQQIVTLQGALSKALAEAGQKELKLIGKDQMRDIDVYEAETKRMAALADMLPMDAEGLRQMIDKLVQESLQTNLTPIVEANADDIDTSASAQSAAVRAMNGIGAGSSTPAGASDSAPVPGARRAPDGEWYLADPTRRGKYLRIAPLAQEHATRGVMSNA